MNGGQRLCSVADPGCLSRIPILICIRLGSRIQKTAKEERSEKNLLSYLFLRHKFHKIENHLIFEVRKKNILANFQRIIELFTQKIVTIFSKILV